MAKGYAKRTSTLGVKYGDDEGFGLPDCDGLDAGAIEDTDDWKPTVSTSKSKSTKTACDINKKLPSMEDTAIERVDSVCDSDVMPERVRPISHPGTKFFRKLVSEKQPTYRAAAKKQKGFIAKEVYDIIACRGGRFVDRLDSGYYYEIPMKRSLKKIMQALRECQKQSNSRANQKVTDPSVVARPRVFVKPKALPRSRVFKEVKALPTAMKKTVAIKRPVQVLSINKTVEASTKRAVKKAKRLKKPAPIQTTRTTKTSLGLHSPRKTASMTTTAFHSSMATAPTSSASHESYSMPPSLLATPSLSMLQALLPEDNISLEAALDCCYFDQGQDEEIAELDALSEFGKMVNSGSDLLAPPSPLRLVSSPMSILDFEESHFEAQSVSGCHNCHPSCSVVQIGSGSQDLAALELYEEEVLSLMVEQFPLEANRHFL